MASRITIIPYLQSWKDNKLNVRLMVLPRGNPLDLPEFPSTFNVKIVSGLSSVPTLSAPTTQVISSPTSPNARKIFEALDMEFKPLPQLAPEKPRITFKKHLPASYQQASQFVPGRSGFTYTDDSYACAMHAPLPKPYKVKTPKNPVASWGKVVATALRQPKLAEELGLIRIVEVPLEGLPDGGWIFFTLDSPIATVYASRIPALTEPCPLFSPVLFLISDAPPTSNMDDAFADVQDYGDGFAKIVHCAQPKSMNMLSDTYDGTHPVNEIGIRLGWDDEQVAIWMNRQLGSMPVTMGVKGYRVDARREGDEPWKSLMFASGPVNVQGTDVGTFDGELMVETHPVQLAGERRGDFWLPAYFTSWTGVSLASLDLNSVLFSGVPENDIPRPRTPGKDPGISLRYGETYEFRVRLVDGTFGGPAVDQESDAAGITKIRFLRWISSQPPVVIASSNDALQLKRPTLGYPAVVFTGGYDDPISLLKEDLTNASGRDVGVPDPDVDSVRVRVEVYGENNNFYEIYNVVRGFPDDPEKLLDLSITWTDVDDVALLSVPDNGIVLPTARNLRISISGLITKKTYLGTDDLKESLPTYVSLRKESIKEDQLFTRSSIKGVFMQPAANMLSLFATQFNFQVNDQTMYASPDDRTIFGCSSKINHILGPKSERISFPSDGDLELQWLVVTRFTLSRDWTWTGMVDTTITRDGSNVGTVTLELKQDGGPQTDFVFIDVVTPSLEELDLKYGVVAKFTGDRTDELIALDIRLPVTVIPTQVPSIVSTGLAMSPYTTSSDYSSTGERQKFLWIEFKDSVLDSRDKYYARVICNTPDPLLSVIRDEIIEAKFPIDPEPIRTVVSGQPNDSAGANAMQEMVSSDSGKHFILPLPPGLSAESPELFGFFTYEFRVGHKDVWCTAQGRYGSPLKVTGLQHPPPPLYCNVVRDRDNISVSAPLAFPVSQGVSGVPYIPNNEVWVMLYVQVNQLDGTSHRNVLLDQQLAVLRRPDEKKRIKLFGTATFPVKKIDNFMDSLGIKQSSSLSVLAVELLPNRKQVADPMTGSLGSNRILRTSTLVVVPPRC